MLDETRLREGEKVIETFTPKQSFRNRLFLGNIKASLLVTDRRVIYKDPPRKDIELDFEDIYDVRLFQDTLNILKKGDSLDYNYDRNFDTLELDRPFIHVKWLEKPEYVKNLIAGLAGKII